jgi:hypothetical protein
LHIPLRFCAFFNFSLEQVHFLFQSEKMLAGKVAVRRGFAAAAAQAQVCSGMRFNVDVPIYHF